ncbi:hypothetical protein [Thermogymnomonas acidicola]|uniref:hypothetical protein n=1 Tax=Thermogymnomonas acidicola TaxID=399579 RepID=UPI0009462814|nr:hypothetical protein [Thermogymnomonas acidicola]
MDTDGLKREIREKIPSGSRICFLRSDHGRDVGDLSDEFQVLDIPIYRSKGCHATARRSVIPGGVCL